MQNISVDRISEGGEESVELAVLGLVSIRITETIEKQLYLSVFKDGKLKFNAMVDPQFIRIFCNNVLNLLGE